MKPIETLITSSINNLEDPKINFDIAVEYEKIGQKAAALSFYLRAAEFGYSETPLITYTSILKAGLCLESQGDRGISVSHNYHQAMSFMPDRPEAYYLLARFYEQNKVWQKAYTFSCMGLVYSGKLLEPLPANVEYSGEYCLLFEKAVVSWWIGRKDESLTLLSELENNPLLDELHRAAVHNNLNLLRN